MTFLNGKWKMYSLPRALSIKFNNFGHWQKRSKTQARKAKQKLTELIQEY